MSGVGVPPAWSLQKLRIYVPGPEGIAGTMEFNPGAPFDRAETALVYHYDHLGSIERITPGRTAEWGSQNSITYNLIPFALLLPLLKTGPHAEARSLRSESHTPFSARSAPPRENGSG
jgi:hypothetical protein